MINLPANVRAVLYAVIAVLSPLVAYLGSAGTISEFVVGLFSVIVTAVSALAFSNVSDKV
jgi:hypothetical protein